MATLAAKIELTKDEYSSVEIELTTTKRHFTIDDAGYDKYMAFCSELWTRLTAPLEARTDD